MHIIMCVCNTPVHEFSLGAAHVTDTKTHHFHEYPRAMMLVMHWTRAKCFPRAPQLPSTALGGGCKRAEGHGACMQAIRVHIL
jgi:hypothetical protein